MFTRNPKTDSPVQTEDTTEDSKDLPAHKAKRDAASHSNGDSLLNILKEETKVWNEGHKLNLEEERHNETQIYPPINLLWKVGNVYKLQFLKYI